MTKGEEMKVEMNSEEKNLFKVVVKRKNVKSEIKTFGLNSFSSVTTVNYKRNDNDIIRIYKLIYSFNKIIM